MSTCPKTTKSSTRRHRRPSITSFPQTCKAKLQRRRILCLGTKCTSGTYSPASGYASRSASRTSALRSAGSTWISTTESVLTSLSSGWRRWRSSSPPETSCSSLTTLTKTLKATSTIRTSLGWQRRAVMALTQPPKCSANTVKQASYSTTSARSRPSRPLEPWPRDKQMPTLRPICTKALYQTTVLTTARTRRSQNFTSIWIPWILRT